MFSMLLMLLLLVRVGLLVGLLVVTGEEEGGGSSDFMLLAGLLANLEEEEELKAKSILLKYLKVELVEEVGLLPIGRSNNNIFSQACCWTVLTLQPTLNNILAE